MDEALAETADAVQEDTPKVEEDGSGKIDATELLGDKRWSMITSKAVKMGIILLIVHVATVIFVKLTKVSDFGISERFFFNQLNLSKNLNCCLVW